MTPTNAEQPYIEKSIFTELIEPSSDRYAISKLLITKGSYFLNLSNRNKCIFKTLIPNSIYDLNNDFNEDKAHVMSVLIKKIHNAKTEKILKLSYGDLDHLPENLYLVMIWKMQSCLF